MSFRVTENKSVVFNNYSEYIYFTKHLSLHQKTSIFESLTSIERKSLEKAFISEGWEDLFIQNELDKTIDLVKKIFNKDLLDIKIKIDKGYEIRIKRFIWSKIQDEFLLLPDNMKKFIFHNIVSRSDPSNSQFIILQKGKTI